MQKSQLEIAKILFVVSVAILLCVLANGSTVWAAPPAQGSVPPAPPQPKAPPEPPTGSVKAQDQSSPAEATHEREAPGEDRGNSERIAPITNLIPDLGVKTLPPSSCHSPEIGIENPRSCPE